MSPNRCGQTGVQFGDWPCLSGGSHSPKELRYEEVIKAATAWLVATFTSPRSNSTLSAGQLLRPTNNLYLNLWAGLDLKSGPVKSGPTAAVAPALYHQWELSETMPNKSSDSLLLHPCAIGLLGVWHKSTCSNS